MNERDLINIVAITCEVDAVGELGMAIEWEWRHGWMHPQTYAEVIHRPPWEPLEDTPMQLKGLGEGVSLALLIFYQF